MQTWIMLTAVVLSQVAETPAPTTQPALSNVAAPTTQPSPLESTDVALPGLSELSPDARIEIIGGQIVVFGTASDRAIVQALVSAMDEAGPAPQVKLFYLKNAQAQPVAQMLQRLWNEMIRGLPQRPENNVTILADQLSNTIVIGGIETNIERLGTLIQQIDVQGSMEGIDWTPVQLKHIRASDAATTVRETLEKIQKRRGGPPAVIDVQVDPRQNSLFIIAPQKDIETIGKLIELIDREPSTEYGGVGRLAVFPLMRSEAEAVQKTLDSMIQMEKQGQGDIREQIRRLRMVKRTPDGKMEELPDLDLEKPIKIIADKGMNAVIIGATDANLKPLSEIVSLLDAVPLAEEMNIRLYALKNASAENLVELLQKMFDQGKKLAEIPGKSIPGAVPEGPAGAAMVYNVSIAADPRTNTVIVAGRLEQIALVQKLIDEMDIEGIGVSFPVEVITLKHASPERMADIVTKLNTQRMDALKNRGVKSTELERVFVMSDVRTDSLILSAKPENVKEVRDLIQKLDTEPLDPLGDVHIITLKNLTATDVGPKIEDLWERRIRVLGKEENTYERPVVITDTRSNSLVIASTNEDYEAIRKLVEQLEQQPLSPTAQIRLLVLRHNEAGKVGPMLDTLFKERAKMRLAKGQEEQPADRLTIVNDPTTNVLFVASSQEVYDEIVKLLAEIDVPLDVTGVVRMFTLQHADVTRAAKMIEDLFGKGIQVPSAVTPSAIPERQRKVSIVTDTRSNTMIISATEENFAIVAALIKQIDSDQAPLFTPETRIFEVVHSDAVKVADNLTKLFEGIRKGLPADDATALNMTFIPDDTSNIVIVTGSRYGMKRAEELIAMIDREPGEPTGVVEVYQLHFATARRLASMLSDLFEKQRPSGQGQRTPLYILADDGSNSLIVTAAKPDHKIVTDLLGMLDRPSTLSQQMEIVGLRSAKAEDLAKTINDLLTKQKAAGGAGEPAFTITAEPKTNSLIVFAGPDVVNNVKLIVEKLDTNQPVMDVKMKVISLKQARAEDLADRLDKFLKGEDQQGDVSRIISFDRFDPTLKRTVERSLVQRDVTIVPDKRTNSLIVLAPPESIEMLDTMVQMLDSVPVANVEINMFLLRNADAQETKDLLEELFQVGSKGTKDENAPEREIVVPVGGPALAAPGVAGGGSGAVELAFSVDKRTNTLIAAGSPDYLLSVEQVVSWLDNLDLRNRVQHVFKLNNAVATDVAQTLEQFFQNEAQLVEQGDAKESLLRRLEREVTVRADEASNSILVSSSPRMETQIFEMINKLDQAPPQVMIQVLMAEVTLNDSIEVGMEFALQDLLFSEHATVDQNNIIHGSNFDFIAGTDVGASGRGSGFNFTITGEDFNFLLHALQSQGRLEVLSRPSIMVADNQTANITVGDEVPVVTNVVFSGGGVTSPTVTYRDVGILLDVEPHINPDGYVNMHVQPTIQSIGTSSVTVATGVTLPTFTKRSADTWVTVRDGETIVIGGLITTTDTDGETKVPGVGDVPILGNLFRATNRSSQKTELLIVLTPKVIRSDRDARDASIAARDATGLLDRVRESPLMEKLQVRPSQTRLGPNEKGTTTQPAAPTDESEQYGPTAPEPEPDDVYGPEVDSYGPDASLIVRPNPVPIANAEASP